MPAAGIREGGSTHPIKPRSIVMRTPQCHTALENPPSQSALEDLRMPVQAKLAAAWTSFMFLYIYVDYFALYKPGVIDDILGGAVFEFDISQTLLTAFLTLIAIPILMVMLSMTLPARVNRTINLVVASLYIPVSMFNAVGESWTYFYGLSIGLEVLLLAFILRSAWTWPRTAAPATRTTSLDNEPHRTPQQA
ncbi:MAG TPA: DUF6326 family protein [Propionibacteriaceae bacterium]|nr:DUF6326 family protein [Propionibacteriaceae bacterium]